MRYGFLVLVAGVGCLLGLGGCGGPGRSLPRSVTILVTGFMQGQIADYEPGFRMERRHYGWYGGALRMNSFLEALVRRREGEGREVVLVDLGDFMSGSAPSGSPEAIVTRGAASAAVMASRPYSAILMGNRELNFGLARLEELVRWPPGGEGRVPLVSTNVRVRPGTSAGAPDFVASRRTVSLESVGRGMTVFGVTPLDLATRAEPEALARLDLEADLARLLGREAGHVGEAGDGDLTVVLSQLDIVADQGRLAGAVAGTGIDLVLGHAYGPSAVARRVGRTWFAGLRNDRPGSALLELSLEVDPDTGRIEKLHEDYYVLAGEGRGGRRTEEPSAATELDPSVPPPPSERLVRRLAGLEGEIGGLDTVLARAEADLTGLYEVESGLGNLVADAIRASVPGAEIGLVSASVVDGVQVRAGGIRLRDLFRMYRYENMVASLELTGAELEEGLARMLEKGLHYQVSGMALRYRPTADGDEGRLEPGLTVGGRLLDRARTYRVAIDSFGLRRNPVFSARPAERRGLCREAVRAHLQALGTVMPRIEGRLVRVGAGR